MEGQISFGLEYDDEDVWRKGPWNHQEDKILMDHVKIHGEGRWNSVAKITGLRRNGKSCRLRWVNYLRPDLKRGKITPQEETIIHELHHQWGNRWSTIARNLPGRTDNEIKNYWRTHFKKNKPSKNVQRARARFLIRQQQNQMQQQNHHDNQIIYAKSYNMTDMQQKQESANMVDEHEPSPLVVHDNFQMMDYLYPLIANGFMLQNFNGATTYHGDGSSEDDDDGGSWGCLWNLDDA